MSETHISLADLAEQSPVEIDTQLAEINNRVARSAARRSSALDTIEQFHAEDNETRTPVYMRVSEYDRRSAEERLIEAEIELEALRLEAKPLNDEYDRRGGWTRFFHVTNTNGHVHTSMSCSSCFPDTQYAWRTDLSGLTDEEIVARESYQACSVCLPIAPADQKAAFKAHQEQKRADKKAEREAKAAEKAARKFAREESAAHKANAALDKLGDDYLKQAWFDGKITDATYDILFGGGRAGNERKY